MDKLGSDKIILNNCLPCATVTREAVESGYFHFRTEGKNWGVCIPPPCKQAQHVVRGRDGGGAGAHKDRPGLGLRLLSSRVAVFSSEIFSLCIPVF